jgi:DNA-binding transcriptional MerR regulator
MKDLSIKKLYYSISEVSKITDLEQYVLRYWETEFEELRPQKNRAGNRIYTNREIKLIMYIKKLLREERYTIEGAKAILKNYDPDMDGEQLRILDKPEQPKIETSKLMEDPEKIVEILLEVKKVLQEIKEKI